VGLAFVVSLDRWKLLGGAIALTLGAIVYAVSRPRST
jgi:hypothetical protein